MKPKSVFQPEELIQPEELTQRVMAATAREVEISLAKTHLEAEDLMALLSPAAREYREPMAQKAHRLTQQRFGRVIKLYAPLYLSNACTNACVYCGFNSRRDFPRRTLTVAQVAAQADYLSRQGFQHVLLVSGESPQDVPIEFLSQCVRTVRERFPEVSLEVYPLETAEYRRLQQDGLVGLALYQETYVPQVYQCMHPSGRKRDYHNRLAAPERGALAGLRQVGLGVLLGLADFRQDGFYLGMHARNMQRRYWQTLVGLSFPRVQSADAGFSPPHPVADGDWVQLVLALRLFLPDAPFSLSTRESAALRRRVLPLGFTQISAGSCTEPGGYGCPPTEGRQFAVQDERSAGEVAAEVAALGYEPVWKDWDAAFVQPQPNPAESSRVCS